MGWLLGRFAWILPYATFLWLALLTLWVWRLSRPLSRSADSEWRSNRPSSAESDFAPPSPPAVSGSSVEYFSRRGYYDDSRSELDPAERRGQPVEPAEPAHAAPRPAAPRPGTEKEKRLVGDFNRLAAGFSPAVLDRFESDWTPTAVDHVSDSRFAAVEGGALWFVATDPNDGWGAILPGAEIVRKWEKFYRNLRGASAPAGLTASYILVEGSVLEVREPASGRIQPGGIRLESQGTLAGI